MPELSQRNNDQLSNGTNSSYYSLRTGNGSVSSNGFWSMNRDDVSCNQLQKFWGKLSPQERQTLLRVDKQTLFEQARKNIYCSRCNGLLLEGFLQIVMYGKSLQQDGAAIKLPCNRSGTVKPQINTGSSETLVCQDELQDPSVHPWGGLTTTRDGALTLLDCYVYSESLKGLQNVFDSARAREREHELLYPDACGGGGRGWISQGIACYGRGHGTRETCALHTARLSCDTLVDFWSALGEETRQSLLRMKEEDFIERLMYRFDSKRFCRDCRRNVIREFKELKELKRMRKEPRCTNWFCAADTAFLCEVSNDTIHANWHEMIIDSVGAYHHFEWAVGTGEGKSDILEFDNVGMNGSVAANGLDLAGLSACYITLRAWKLDGRCTELSVKAHALKGDQCVHSKLVVGDGYVTITRGDSIRRFFEHAEEAEEEEDDDSVDKDGNDLDECFRPQKHAKSPELAREFLLDAATVIFKEQVEKAFREGTARQNAHSIFVCLSLKLLEDRVHVACREIITLEKQMKLLEEEEKEKREEEERKERKRTKEKEKKLRRKERLKGKDKEKKCAEPNLNSVLPDVSEEVSLPCPSSTTGSLVIEAGDGSISLPTSPDAKVQASSDDYNSSDIPSNSLHRPEGEPADVETGNCSFMNDNSKASRQLKFQREFQLDFPAKWPDRRGSMENSSFPSKSESRYYDEVSEGCSRGMNGLNRQRPNAAKFNPRGNGSRYNQKLHVSSYRNDLQFCGCNQQNLCRTKVELNVSPSRLSGDTKSVVRSETASDLPKQIHRNTKVNPTDHVHNSCRRSRSKVSCYSNFSRDPFHTKKVWEPVEPQKKYPRCNSDADVTLRSCTLEAEGTDPVKTKDEVHSNDDRGKPLIDPRNTSHGVEKHTCLDGSEKETMVLDHTKEPGVDVDSCITNSCNSNDTSYLFTSSSSSSDNCSSCTSEGDGIIASSNPQILEPSCASDSEEGLQHFEDRNTSVSSQNGFSGDHEVGMQKSQKATDEDAMTKVAVCDLSSQNAGSNESNSLWNSPTKLPSQPVGNGKITQSQGSLHRGVLPPIRHQNVHVPNFQVPSTLGYYHQNPASWSTAPSNGLMSFPNPNHYLFTSPLGYGLTADSHFCVQYGSMQPMVSPVHNSGQIPAYQPVLTAKGFNTPRESNIYKADGALDRTSECRRQNVDPVGRHLLETPLTADMQNWNSANARTGMPGFSLFQFGGPVALSTYHSNPHSTSDEGLAGDISTKWNADHDEGDSCSKQETMIEEYNLFAASNGIQFSFF
ncbi:hypothetical protein Dimus_029634 [Dionaea muscipula]